jgi:hypothetical protein
MSTRVRYTTIMSQMPRGVDSNGKPYGGQPATVNGVPIGFRAMVLEGDEGEIQIMANPMQDHNVCQMIDTGDWTLFGAGAFPGVLDEDGNSMLRLYNSVDYEIRIGGWGQSICRNPGGIVRISLAE